jgi:hypothetical protein
LRPLKTSTLKWALFGALIERMVTDKEFGLQVSMRLQHDLDVHLEYLLADQVRAYLADHTALFGAQRSQIQMEIVNKAKSATILR